MQGSGIYLREGYDYRKNLVIHKVYQWNGLAAYLAVPAGDAVPKMILYRILGQIFGNYPEGDA